MLLILLAGAGFLLIVSCANVMSLLFARGAARRAEIAIRQAVGAGKGRLARQFLTEALVLSSAGGVLGLLLAGLGVEALLALEPGQLPRADDVGVNGMVLAFAIGAIFSGFGPAVILYVILWVVMPLETIEYADEDPEDADWGPP